MGDIISTLKRLANQGDASLNVEERINHWLKSAKRILALVNGNPAIPASLIHINNDLPKGTQQLLLLALFGKLCRFNDHYLQHIIGSLLATYWLSDSKKDKRNIAEVIRFLRQHNLTIWLDTLRLQKAFQSERQINYIADKRLNIAQRLCLLAGVFAFKSGKTEHTALFTLIAPRLPVQHRHYIASLMPLFEYPLPGAKVYANGIPGVIVDRQQSHAFVFALSNEGTDGKWIPLSSIHSPVKLSVPFEHFVALYTDTAKARLSQGGTSFLPFTFAMQHPPKALLGIIDSLQKPDVDIPALCEKIEQVPTFNQFLIHTASQDNRLQLPVKSLKQAVLTYGIERVGDMLVQFALLERLTQNHFPLMAMCKQVTLLACSFASHFAQVASTKFSPQSAALSMTFVCSPLFTLPGFKVAQSLPVDKTKNVTVNSAFKVKSSTPWLAIASELAGSWHQSSTWRAVIHQCNKSTSDVPKSLQKEQAIILLGFSLAKSCLLTQDFYTLLKNIEVKTILRILSLDEEEVLKALDANAHLLYCPLSI